MHCLVDSLISWKQQVRQARRPGRERPVDLGFNVGVYGRDPEAGLHLDLEVRSQEDLV